MYCPINKKMYLNLPKYAKKENMEEQKKKKNQDAFNFNKRRQKRKAMEEKRYPRTLKTHI